MNVGFVVVAVEFGVVAHPTFWIFFPSATRRLLTVRCVGENYFNVLENLYYYPLYPIKINIFQLVFFFLVLCINFKSSCFIYCFHFYFLLFLYVFTHFSVRIFNKNLLNFFSPRLCFYIFICVLHRATKSQYNLSQRDFIWNCAELCRDFHIFW